MLESDNYQKAIKVKDPQSFGGKASACVSFFSQLSIVSASDLSSLIWKRTRACTPYLISTGMRTVCIYGTLLVSLGQAFG
jgi:hypothetical protein